MKKTFWLVIGAMLSTGLLAQQVTNAPPSGPIATPAPATTPVPSPAELAAPPTAAPTNAPAAKAGKKKSAPKKKGEKKGAKKPATKPKAAAGELKTVPLTPGPAVVVASNVNVRGQAKLRSEVVTRVTKDQTVTVLEEITLKHSGPDEPSAWAKILLPPDSHVWVNKSFIDATSKTVVPRKLNVRSGAGENYSVLGLLYKGDTVQEVGTKGDWLEIQAPTNAYAFVAAQFLKQEAPAAPATPPATALAATPPMPAAPAAPATPATVVEAPTIAPAPAETPTPPAPVTPPPPAPPVMTPPPAEAPAIPAVAAPPTPPEPPPKRIVQREGQVRGTVSIQAPTRFELVSPQTHRAIDYLYTASPDLDLRRYKGLRIVVAGEESLDERWGNTPVLTIQKIEVLSDFSDYVPGQRH